MRRLVLVVLALACAPTAAAADLTVVPRDFSPDDARLDRRAAASPFPDAALERSASRCARAGGQLSDPARRRLAAACLVSTPDRPDRPACNGRRRAQWQPRAVPKRQRAADDDLPERRPTPRRGQDPLHPQRARSRPL